MNFLLDTDTLSHIIKKQSPHHTKLINKLKTYSPKQISISIFTVCELYFGLERIDKRQTEFYNQIKNAIEALTIQMNVLDIPDNFAKYYGQIRSTLVSEGQDIGVIDSMIAAQAIATNHILVTHNTKHFQRIQTINSVKKLKILDWIADTK